MGTEKKVAYLFGAGATHAEIQNLKPNLVPDREGLLIGNVSSRVIERARRKKEYIGGLEAVSSTSGSLNIELLISLIESSRIDGWAEKSELLKTLIKDDIQGILTDSRRKSFHLHRALFELHHHKVAMSAERVIGFLSLNYDTVLDDAYKEFVGDPNYCFSLDASLDVPLLKLHGSFGWVNKVIRGRRRTVDIIPLGSNKSYLHIPYGFMWSRALEILASCDVLRVVGCAISPNDAHLVDLLFKAHLERGEGFEIEVIGPALAGDNIRQGFGFFPHIKGLLEIEGELIPDRSPENPFKTWLKYKSLRMLGSKRVKRTSYLNKVIG